MSITVEHVSISPQWRFPSGLHTHYQLCEWTYGNIPPEFSDIVVVYAQKFCEPADGSLAAFVHRLVTLKVLIVFVYRVIRQVHVQLTLEERLKKSALTETINIHYKNVLL